MYILFVCIVYRQLTPSTMKPGDAFVTFDGFSALAALAVTITLHPVMDHRL